MKVDGVIFKKTLKCGVTTYGIGTILDSRDGKIPPDIIEEIRANTGTVEVLSIEELDLKRSRRIQSPAFDAAKLEAQAKLGDQQSPPVAKIIVAETGDQVVPEEEASVEKENSRLVG